MRFKYIFIAGLLLSYFIVDYMPRPILPERELKSDSIATITYNSPDQKQPVLISLNESQAMQILEKISSYNMKKIFCEKMYGYSEDRYVLCLTIATNGSIQTILLGESGISFTKYGKPVYTIYQSKDLLNDIISILNITLK